MSENNSDFSPVMDLSGRHVSDLDNKNCIEAEIKEMEKYKWCLGVELKHDPLIDRSLNDIYCEWIEKYAADFRTYWREKGSSSFRGTQVQ